MKEEIVSGVIIDERVELSTRDLCRACASSQEWVVALVEEGVLSVQGSSSESWRFSGVSLSRAIQARRLQQDLELNLQGVALVLDMMDEINELRLKLRQHAEI